MDDLLIEILEKVGYEVIKQGTIEADEECPRSFFTYWNWDSPRNEHYDNKYHSVTYYYQIQFFSDDIKIVDVAMNKAVELLENNGFNIDEEPTDTYSDIPNYTGKYLEANIEKRRS